MELEAKPGAVTDITAEQLRKYIETHTARDYLLVDVRQPEEYELSHIPGASLIPVMELENRIEEVHRASEPVKIFYCRSGGRSARAAATALEHGIENVFNVTGGILAWRGERLPDIPNLRAFEDTDSVEELLIAALDLEKGAHRLYEALYRAFIGTPLESELKKLTWVEVGHEKIIYRQLVEKASNPVPPFDELMAKLRGDVIESGEPLDQVLATARQLSSFGGAAVLELALELELRAFEMYRTLAHDSVDPEFREVFLDLATQERTHAHEVLGALGKIAGDRTTWMG
jgi:rhodanese-related sulfurtransferase/rubrerythrin